MGLAPTARCPLAVCQGTGCLACLLRAGLPVGRPVRTLDPPKIHPDWCVFLVGDLALLVVCFLSGKGRAVAQCAAQHGLALEAEEFSLSCSVRWRAGARHLAVARGILALGQRSLLPFLGIPGVPPGAWGSQPWPAAGVGHRRGPGGAVPGGAPTLAFSSAGHNRRQVPDTPVC